MKDALAKMQAEASRLPPPLRRMVALYAERAAERGNVAGAARLLRTGAELLNITFKAADAGDEHVLQAMRADGVDALSIAHCAELFATTASVLERSNDNEPSASTAG